MQVRKIPEGGVGGRASALRAAPSGTVPAADSSLTPRPGQPPTVSSHLTNPPLKPSQSALPMVSFLLDESRKFKFRILKINHLHDFLLLNQLPTE